MVKMDLIIFLVIIFGLMWGSFLSVVIWRVDDLRSIIVGRSKCPHCEQKIKWYDLVPLISYGILRGRCRQCGAKISSLYPTIELISAVVAFLVYQKFGLSWEALIVWLIISTMVVTLGYDAIHMLVVDQVVWIGIVLVVVYQLVAKTPDTSWLAMGSTLGYGLLIGLGLPLLLVLMGRGKWMGEGDVMLGAMIGLFVGYPNIIVAYVIAFITGALFGISLLIAARKNLKDAVAFGPFLVLGSIVAFFYGRQLIDWYLGIGLVR